MSIQYKNLGKELPKEEEPIADDAGFPTEPERIMFNMFDAYRNESIYVKDWMEYVRYSFLYMSYVPDSVCKIFFNLQKD